MKKIFTFSILSLLITFFNLESSGQTGFVENKGQVVDQFGVPNSDALFVLPLAGMNVVLYQDGFSYNVFQSKEGYVPACEAIRNNTFIDAKKLKEDAKVNVYRVDIKFLNSSLPNVRSVGKLQGVKNYFTTGTPEGGVTGVNTFEKVLMEGMYPGIDVEFTYSKNKGLEYNFIVSSEGNYQDIKMKYFGFSELNLEESILKIKVKDGIELEERIPASWIKQSGEPLSFNYDVNSDVVSFRTDSEISNHSIVIDPTPNLVYASYFGGEGHDGFYDAIYDNLGNLFIAGSTGSNDNIATVGAHQTTLNGISNALLLKFNNSDNLEWCTYYGGESEDAALALEILGDYLILAGSAFSATNISTIGSFQPNLIGFKAGFVAKFSLNGELLKASYYGNGIDGFIDMKISSDDMIIACGSSQSETLAFADNGYQMINGGLVDGLITVFDENLNPTFSTFIGGEDLDALFSLSQDNLGNVYFAGSTYSEGVPVTPNAIQSTNAGSNDILLVRTDIDFNIDLISYFGSSGDESRCILNSSPNGLIMFFDAAGSNLFISPEAEQQFIYGPSDVYMCKMDNNLDIVFGGYIGGEETESIDNVLLINDEIFITGRTLSEIGISTVEAPFASIHANPEDELADVFIIKLDENFNKEWGTYFGDYSFDSSRQMLLKNGKLTLIGSSHSTVENLPEYQDSFVTSNAYQTQHGGLSDGFIARFDAVTGVRELGLDDVSWNVFPNPSSSEVNIELPLGERNWQLDFYDVQGRNVLQKSVQTDFIAIDILSLPTGVYTLKARNENHSLSMKVVKR